MTKKINIKDIPNEFIIGNLTIYQIELLELKFAVINKFYEYLNTKKYNITDIYYLIAEDYSITPRTAKAIILTIRRKDI
jgi:hypothetical protein